MLINMQEMQWVEAYERTLWGAKWKKGIGKKRTMMMMEDRRSKLVMENLKHSLLFRLAAFNPSVSINATHASFVEHRLQHLFNSFHTPTHPPYPLMIKRAIVELKEETGSTEEAISEFIRREYEDLPWAHVSILDLHLRRLCLDRDIVCTENGRYVLLVDCDGEVIERDDDGLQDQEIKEQSLVSELHGAGTNILNRAVELTDGTEEHDKQGKSERLLLGVVELEQQSQSDCRGSAVSEDHFEAEE